MKIIIVGCGKVGYAIAQQLTQEKHDITRMALVMKAMKKREVFRTRGPICAVRSRSLRTEEGMLSSLP